MPALPGGRGGPQDAVGAVGADGRVLEAAVQVVPHVTVVLVEGCSSGKVDGREILGITLVKNIFAVVKRVNGDNVLGISAGYILQGQQPRFGGTLLGVIQGCSRVMTRPAGWVRSFHHLTVRVGS